MSSHLTWTYLTVRGPTLWSRDHASLKSGKLNVNFSSKQPTHERV